MSVACCDLGDAGTLDGSNSSPDSGAVYVLASSGAGAWAQQTYVKATNSESGDHFGHSIALAGDGSTLAVGAPMEDSSAIGIGGSQTSNARTNSGAVYVYR